MYKIKSIKTMEKKFKKSELVKQVLMKKSFTKPMSCETIINLRQIAMEKREDQDFVFNNLIEIISNKETLILAYELIKSNPGSMALGPTKETLDSLTVDWVEKTSRQLMAGKYYFTPAKRVLIQKGKKNTTHPLGISNSREKIVQKAILLVLEAIYEPIFSPHSHGCREAKGNHTALKEIKTKFSGANWIVEADISKCFDNIDHATLLNILKKKIRCEKTLALIKRALACGYIFESTIHRPKIGIPQGSVVSPILCNIYLDVLDQFLTQQKKSFDSVVEKRPRNPLLKRLTNKINKKCTTKEQRKKLRTQMAECYGTLNIDFKRLYFVRYVDDYFIGIAGKYQDALHFKNLIKNFLLDVLKMELNMTKTKITKFSSNKVFYLGVFIRGTYRKKKKVTKYVRKRKFITSKTTPRVSFHAPIQKVLENLTENGFFKRKESKFMPTSLGRVVNFNHGDIIRYYNSMIYGILNYFSFVDNKKSLGSIVHGLKMSAARTFALKYKSRSVKPIFIKYGKLLTCPETKAEIYIPKTFARDQIFLIDVKKAEDVIKIKWNNKLTNTNLLKPCCICGSTENIHMHHLKHVKDLKSKYANKEIDFFTLQMRAINRKQLPLCKAHHNAVHNNSLTLDEKKSFLKAIKPSKSGSNKK
jgi:group II intron reverse transcriptase/maturase